MPLMALATGSSAPVGPEGWSGLAWLGFAMYVGLFVLALWGITRLLGKEPAGEREEP